MDFGTRKKDSGLFKILICLIANFTFFGICYYIGLPMHMEHVGSFYAAAAFGFVPAIIVAVISQLCYALFYFGFSYVLMLVPVALVLLLIASAVHYSWLDTIVSSLGTMTMATLINLALMLLISLMIGRAFLGYSCWTDIYDTLTRHLQYNAFEASLITVVPFAVINTFSAWIVALFAYRLSPKQATLGFSDTIYKKRLQNRK